MKTFLKIIAVIGIFGVIFLGNLWFKTTDLQNAKKIKNNLNSTQLEQCEKQTGGYSMSLGCVSEDFGIGSYAMWLSAFVFVFLSSLLFKPGKQYFYIVPTLLASWIIFSELIIRFYSVPVLHSVPMEGDQQTLDGLYFQFRSDLGLEIFFIFLATLITGLVAYGASKEIRKFITSHNSA